MNNQEKVLTRLKENMQKTVCDFIDSYHLSYPDDNHFYHLKEMVDDGVNDNILTPLGINAMTFYDRHEDAILDILDNEYNSRYSFVEAICEMGEGCYRMVDLKYMFGMYALNWCAKVVYDILNKHYKGDLYEG